MINLDSLSTRESWVAGQDLRQTAGHDGQTGVYVALSFEAIGKLFIWVSVSMLTVMFLLQVL